MTALRTTFTVNTSLKRLFLADTGVTTDGAISLAEFLPETKSLLHLDLTSNPQIETAGILALSVGLKSNTLIRCLDLSIPPNSPNLAELSQSILQSCIRNTELAADTAKPGPGQEAVWQPIKKSALVKDVKAADRLRQDKEREDIAKSSEGQAREYVYTLKPNRLIPQSEEVVRDLERWFQAGNIYSQTQQQQPTLKNPGWRGVWEADQLPSTDFDLLYERAKILRERIVDRIHEGPESQDEMESLLGINDTLSNTLEAGIKFQPPPRLLLPSQIVPIANTNTPTDFRPNYATTANSPARPTQIRNDSASSNTSTPGYAQVQAQAQGGVNGIGSRGAPMPRVVRRHMRIPSLEISSPNFSIGDSDNDSDADAEEVDVGSFEQSPPRLKGLMGSGALSHSLAESSSSGSPSKSRSATSDKNSSSQGLSMEAISINSTGTNPVSDLLSVANIADDEIHSPTERVSRAWVEEEGEIFRKGTKLGVAEEDEVEDKGDVSGEQLKQEVSPSFLPSFRYTACTVQYIQERRY